MNQVKKNLTRQFTESGQNSRYFINHLKYMIPSFEGVLFLCFSERSKGLFIYLVGDCAYKSRVLLSRNGIKHVDF